MYKRLFVAADGSEPGAAALKEAIKLVQADGGELHVAFVVHQAKTFGHPVVNLVAAERALEVEGQGVLDQAASQARAAGVTATTAMVRSDREPITATLLAEAARWQADLIVMGTHGRRGFGRAVLGSVAENLLRVSTLPVLMVHAHA